MLYICTKFCQSISKGFRVTDPNSRVKARVVANVKNGRTNGQKIGSLHRAMPEAGTTKISDKFEFGPNCTSCLRVTCP